MPLSFVNAVQTVVGFFLTFDHQVVLLTWWAVFRDSFYYTLSVVALIAVRQHSMSVAGGDIRFFLIVSFFSLTNLNSQEMLVLICFSSSMTRR